MRVNRLDAFADERVEVETEPLEDYERRQAEMQARFQEALAQHTSVPAN